MRKFKLIRFPILVLSLFLTTTLLSTANTSAQEQTNSASAATKTSNPEVPSDLELRKTLARALDKVETQQRALWAKDEVIAAQEEENKELTTSRDTAIKAAELYKSALETQKEATAAAKAGWKADEERVKELEKKLRKSDNKVKWFAAGAIAAGVAAFLLRK